MLPLPPCDLTDTSFVQRIFHYQQTKRLHLLMDQILWSFDLIATASDSPVANPYLRQMMQEATNHAAALASD